MKNSKNIIVVLSVIATIVAIVLNFNEFLMGNYASVKNLLVTFSYMAIWILVLIVGSKTEDCGIIKYCSIFWIITLLTAIVAWYANATDAIVDWAIPFVILFLGQWYGLAFFTHSSLTMSIIITFMSLGMLIITLMLFKHIERT